MILLKDRTDLNEKHRIIWTEKVGTLREIVM